MVITRYRDIPWEQMRELHGATEEDYEYYHSDWDTAARGRAIIILNTDGKCQCCGQPSFSIKFVDEKDDDGRDRYACSTLAEIGD